MHTAEFKFASGDFVRTLRGGLGTIVSCVEEYGACCYFVDTAYSRKAYHENQLTATDDRPFGEMAKRPAANDADPSDALSN